MNKRTRLIPPTGGSLQRKPPRQTGPEFNLFPFGSVVTAPAHPDPVHLSQIEPVVAVPGPPRQMELTRQCLKITQEIQSMSAARVTTPRNEIASFSRRAATPVNLLILQKKFSTRCRFL